MTLRDDAYSDERAAARDARDQDPGHESERPSLAELRDDEREAAAHETARIQRNTVRVDGWNYWHNSYLRRVNGADTPPEGRRSSRSTTGTSQQSAAATDPPCAPEPPTSASPGGARSSAILSPPTDASLTERTASVGQHPAANTAANHGQPQADPGDRRCTLPPAAVAGPLAPILTSSALTSSALIGAL